MALVAILGTTLSPYLLCWQSSQEVEEAHRRHLWPLRFMPRDTAPELARIRTERDRHGDLESHCFFIVVAIAATLNASGVTDIQASSQAAEALRSAAGPLVKMLASWAGSRCPL